MSLCVYAFIQYHIFIINKHSEKLSTWNREHGDDTMRILKPSDNSRFFTIQNVVCAIGVTFHQAKLYPLPVFCLRDMNECNTKRNITTLCLSRAFCFILLLLNIKWVLKNTFGISDWVVFDCRDMRNFSKLKKTCASMLYQRYNIIVRFNIASLWLIYVLFFKVDPIVVTTLPLSRVMVFGYFLTTILLR